MFRFGFQTAARKPEDSAALLEQELSHCGIFRQTDRSVVGVCGLTLFPKTLQEVSANSPVRLIVRHSVRGNRVQNGESCFWCLRFRNCGGVSDSCAERGRYADQLFVKQCYRRPVGPASVCTLRMYRLNCSFELKPAGAPALESIGEMTFRLFLKEVTIASGPARKEERTGHQAPCVPSAVLHSAA
jgi:hypothetical protein